MSSWQFVCELDELLPDSGVAALIDGRQLAIFRVGQQVYALDNFDPHSAANVLSRGIVGDMQGTVLLLVPPADATADVVASYQALYDGQCADARYSVAVPAGETVTYYLTIDEQPSFQRLFAGVGNELTN